MLSESQMTMFSILFQETTARLLKNLCLTGMAETGLENGTKPGIQSGAGVDVVFMDPPRAGSDQRFLSSLLQCAPKKIVYISCNMETQRRDLEVLLQGGYRVKTLQPVDMFPFTNHVENIALLVKV